MHDVADIAERVEMAPRHLQTVVLGMEAALEELQAVVPSAVAAMVAGMEVASRELWVVTADTPDADTETFQMAIGTVDAGKAVER